MGTAMAHVLACRGHSVSLWDHFREVIDIINHERENPRFLPGVSIHLGVIGTASVEECIRGARLVVLCVPSAFLLGTVGPHLGSLSPGAMLLSIAKGFAPGSHGLFPELLKKMAPSHDCVHLAGPAIANEFVRGSTASVVVASESETAARAVADALAGEAFHPSVTTDVAGAALGGILKNVYAIMLGCISRLGGESRNLEAAALAAAVSEMAVIAEACGGRKRTIFGLAGLGDLIATGSSSDSHNRKFGRALATGKSSEELKAELGWLPEGVAATHAACELASAQGVPAPLAEWVLQTLSGRPPALRELKGVLRHSPRPIEFS